MNSKTKILNLENNKLDEQFSVEDQKVFTDIICYLRGSNLSDYDIEVIRHDIYEMVLSAQERGENMDSVINNDYKEFCDNIIASLPQKTKKQKFIDFIDVISLSTFFLLFINIVASKDTISIIENVVKGTPVDYAIGFSYGSVISIGVIIVISYAFIEVIMKNAFSENRVNKKMMIFIGLILALVFLGIAWLGKATFFTINIFVIIAITIGLFGLHKVLEKV